MKKPALGQSKMGALSSIALLTTSSLIFANPVDPNPTVVVGQVDFSGLQTNDAVITQGSQQAIVDYTHFNVPEAGSVQFVQPNSQAAILNRITGADPSTINGTLLANGQVFFVNPAGVTFGSNSVVRADIFMAAAGNISNENFLSRLNRFDLSGRLENNGSIVTENGVGLFGSSVLNTGEVVSKNGYAVVASGDEVFLRQGGTGLVMDITDGAANSKEGIGVENLGTVDGEEVMFSAGDAFSTAIQHNGSARANKSVKLQSDGGNISVSGNITASDVAGGGRIEVGGTDKGAATAPTAATTTITETAVLDASAGASGDGGHIVVWSDGLTSMFGNALATGASGGHVEVSGRTFEFYNVFPNITVGNGGSILIDPENYLIDSATASEIVTQLNNGVDVTIETTAGGASSTPVFTNTGTGTTSETGDIIVDADIVVPDNGSNAGTLTLDAVGSIRVNAKGDASARISNAQTAFNGASAKEDVFVFTADEDIILNAPVAHFDAVTGPGQGNVKFTAGRDIILNSSLDAGEGSVFLSAGRDVTVSGAGTEIVSGGDTVANNVVSILSTEVLTFDGGLIRTFGDSDIVIQADQFVNNTGSTVFVRNGSGVTGGLASEFAIYLPHPDGTEANPAVADRHRYNNLQSGNLAQFNSADVSGALASADGTSGSEFQNEYHYSFTPQVNITANNNSKTYGNLGTLASGASAVTVTTSDFVAVPLGSPFLQDTTAATLGLTGVTVSSTGTAALADAGTYNDITATGATSSTGYSINYNAGTYTVNPRALTITASAQEKFYGENITLDNTAFTIADLGVPADTTLPNGDVVNTVTVASALGADASTSQNAATYDSDLSLSGQSGNARFNASNYDITYATADFLIKPRPVTVTASEQTKFYGNALDLTSNDSRTSFSINDTVDASPLTLPNGESIDLVNLQSFAPGDSAASLIDPVATYTDELEISGVEGGNGFNLSNYALTFERGDLVIAPRPITLTPTTQSKLYGDTLTLANTFDASSFTILDRGELGANDATLPNGQLVDSLPLTSSTGIDQSTDSNVGTYTDEIEVVSASFGDANGSNGFLLSNYDVQFGTADLQINQRPITLTARQQEKFYGNTLALDTTQFDLADKGNALDTSLPNGEVITNVTLSSATGVDASTTTDAASYANEIVIDSPTTGVPLPGVGVTADFLESNYDITFVNAPLVVNQRPVRVTALAQDKIYGDNTALDDTSTAFSILDLSGVQNLGAALPNSESIAQVNVSSLGGHDSSTTSNAILYTNDLQIASTVSPNGAFKSSNYAFTFVNGNYTINRRPATLTALGQEKDYGDVHDLGNTDFSVSATASGTGLANAESIDTVTLVSAAGIDASTDADASNYVDNISITPTSTGTPTLTGSNGFNQENYVFSYDTGDLLINQRAITLSAENQSKLYGNTLTLDDTAFTTTDRDGGSALPNGEVVTNVTISSATAIDASTTADVATYTDEIVIGSTVTGTPGTGDGFLEANYDITYETADLIVNPRPVQVTALAQEKTYGDNTPLDNTQTSFSILDLSGTQNLGAALPNGEEIASVNISSLGGHDSSTTSNAIGYTNDLQIASTVSPNGAFKSSNYAFTFVNGNYTINRRPATLTALGQNKDYGDVLNLDDTAFSVSATAPGTGLANSETIDTVTLVSASGIDASTDADASNYVDNISITPTSTGTPTLTGSNGFNQENYILSYNTGDLLINQRAITLSAGDQSKIYGNTLTLDDTAFTTTDRDGGSALPNGEVVTNVAISSATGVDASTTSDAATYSDEIVIGSTVTGTDGTGDGFLESNYDITYETADLIVTPRAIRITALSQDKTYGENVTLDATDFSVVDLVDGGALPNNEIVNNVQISSLGSHDSNTSTTATTKTDDLRIGTVGTGGSGFDPDNYTITRVDGDFTVNKRTITLTASAQNKTYGDVDVLASTGFTVTDNFDGGALPNGETVTSVTYASIAQPGSTSANVGTYNSVLNINGQSGSNGFSAQNYTINKVAGNYTITARPITIDITDQERSAGAFYEIDKTEFTVSEVLPNGEQITELNITSANGIATNPSASPDLYSNELIASTTTGSTNYAASNYSITINSADFTVLEYPGIPSTTSESSAGEWIENNLGYSPQAPFKHTRTASQSVGLQILSIEGWHSLTLTQRKQVLSQIGKSNLEELTREDLEALINAAKSE